MSVRMVRRGHASSILVAALSSAFGVILLLGTGVLSTSIERSRLAEHGSVQLDLMLVAAVFIVIAVYVGALVITNTFATIVAGRARTLALYRLIGSSSVALRRSVAREGLLVGALGAVIGALSGIVVVVVGVRILIGIGLLPDLPYPFVTAVILVPAIVVLLTTWWAAWIGSRRVLSVSPLQAVGASTPASREDSTGSRLRLVVCLVMIGAGFALLAAGIVIGMRSPAGLLIALLGGLMSFGGLVAGANRFMPPVLHVVGRALGSSAPARLAAANTHWYPERSARTSVGLVIGVTLVTMFSVAAQCYQNAILASQRAAPGLYADSGVNTVLTVTVTVFSILVGFSALIAAVGVVNNLSLSVLQRTRELGLLRALGFSARQARIMILAESAQLTVASVVAGLVLGTVYGWAGAQSLLGSLPGGGLLAPAIPWTMFLIAAIAAAALAVTAAIAPARRAVSVAPVAALAAD